MIISCIYLKEILKKENNYCRKSLMIPFERNCCNKPGIKHSYLP